MQSYQKTMNYLVLTGSNGSTQNISPDRTWEESVPSPQVQIGLVFRVNTFDLVINKSMFNATSVK